MPRFFFHINRAGHLVPDPDGEVLNSLASAQREAEAVARDLMAERLRSGLSLGLGWEVLISTEDGRIASTVSFSSAVPPDGDDLM